MPNMEDVAKLAGVSLSTVSHALSGKRPISEGTKQRIFAAMKELDFHPNELARRLANKQSQIIGFIFPSINPDGLSTMQLEFIMGAIKAAEENNYALLFSSSPEDDNDILRFAREGLVEGLILMEIKEHDIRVEKLREASFPFVMIGLNGNPEGISYIDLDFPHAIKVGIQYLKGLEHKHIAYIGYSLKEVKLEYGPEVRSYNTYLKIMKQLGLPDYAYHSVPSPYQGYKTVKKLLSEHPEVTAIITPNEFAIQGMYEAVNKSGLKIPQDFSIISITSKSRADMLIPPLTTVDFPAAEMSKLAVESLVEILSGKEKVPRQTLIKTMIIIRQSSGPCPKLGKQNE